MTVALNAQLVIPADPAQRVRVLVEAAPEHGFPVDQSVHIALHNGALWVQPTPLQRPSGQHRDYAIVGLLSHIGAALAERGGLWVWCTDLNDPPQEGQLFDI